VSREACTGDPDHPAGCRCKAEARDALHRAFERGELSLYLGAGVSKGNHLPTWQELVLAMYFNAVSSEEIRDANGRRMRPFPNYLHAIAEWQLRRRTEPLEITARKLRMYYDALEEEQGLPARTGQKLFHENLHRTLYASLLGEEGRVLPEARPEALRLENATLDAVARLCEAKPAAADGVQSVITYNYDDLLEQVLVSSGTPFQAISDADDRLQPDRLPIYHVHGLVPLAGRDAAPPPEHIVFTEDQYHLAARDAYSWSSLVQLQAMSSNVGLLVGLSATDRNMRRLLDAVRRAPLRGRTWALLKKDELVDPDTDELRKIHERAIAKIAEFSAGGAKAGIKRDVGREGVGRWVKSDRPQRKSSLPTGPGRKHARVYEAEICQILEGVHAIDARQEDAALRELGVTPLRFGTFEEIADFVKEVAD